MAFYAMVVVVEADDEKKAHDKLGIAHAKFLSEPWEIETYKSGPVFDTLECFYDHPEAPMRWPNG